MMLFYHVCLSILLPFVALSKSEEVNISLSTHLDRQNKLFSILHRVHQPRYLQEHIEIASAWSFEEHKANFSKADVVTKFVDLYKDGLLPKEEVFTPFYERHLEEAIALFRLFFYAKDWDTFYKTIAWARINVNSQMLVYALYVAADHREDCRHLVLPPIYEVYPQLFFNPNNLRDARLTKGRFDDSLVETRTKHDLEFTEYDPDKQVYRKKKPSHNVSITTRDYFKNLADSVYRYTGRYTGGTPLQYLYEDIGVNAMYYYFNIRYPLWMSSKEFKLHPRRGEVFLHFYQQLSAKHHLERTLAGIPKTTEFDFDGVIDNQFTPILLYPNGQRMPERWGGPFDLRAYYSQHSEMASEHVHIHSHTLLVDGERRIRDAIDSGLVRTRNGSELHLFTNITEGVNLIGNMIEGNADSPNQPFYGSMMFHARHLLGYPKRLCGEGPVAPCAVEQLETSLRDNVFWRLIQKIVNLYQRYLYHLPPYTLEDLVVPGVKIKGMDIGKLTKNTEVFEVDLINAIDGTESEKFGDYEIHLHQVRPKPDNFTYKIHVQSETSMKLCFKVFIGPTRNDNGLPVKLSKHRMDMFNLDRFTYHLQKGYNAIERNIIDSPYFTSDEIMFSDTYHKILSALSGNTTYTLETFDLSNTYAWPLRFALPLGKTEGYAFKFFVAAFQENDSEEDPLSLLYPFDRLIKNEEMFLTVPNFHSHTASVYAGKDLHAREEINKKGTCMFSNNN